MRLLSVENKKFKKAEKFNYLQVGLSLAPHKLANPKINLCSHASPSCISSCINYSGNGGYTKVQSSRILKTLSFLENRKEFMLEVNLELQWYKLKAKKEGKKLVVRLNTYSDINFKNLKIEDGKNIFQLNPSILFIDYTKNLNFTPEYDNYKVIYSADRYLSTDEMLISKLQQGHNIAMVFLNDIPKTWNGFEVIDGDESDVAWIDKKSVISALKYKNIVKKGVSNKDLVKNNTLIYE